MRRGRNVDRKRYAVGVAALALWALTVCSLNGRLHAADIELVSPEACAGCCGDETSAIHTGPSESETGHPGCAPPHSPTEPDNGQGAVVQTFPLARYTSVSFATPTGYPPPGDAGGWKFDPPTVTYNSSQGTYGYHGSYRLYTYNSSTQSYWGRWDNRLSELKRNPAGYYPNKLIISDKGGREFIFDDPAVTSSGKLLEVNLGGGSRLYYNYSGSNLSEVWRLTPKSPLPTYTRLRRYDAWGTYGPSVVREYVALVDVTSRTYTPSQWTLVHTTTFRWHQSGWPEGQAGDLMGIDVEEELSRDGEQSLSRTVFRYYTTAETRQLRAVMGPESYRDYVVTHGIVGPSDDVFSRDLTYLTGTNPYTRDFVDEEYSYHLNSDSPQPPAWKSLRLRSRTVRNAAGSCGCSGSTSGTFWYDYDLSTSNPNLDTWYTHVEVRKGSSFASGTPYAYLDYNIYGKKLIEALIDPASSTRMQIRRWRYSTTTGALTASFHASACSAYDPATKAVTLRQQDGVVYWYIYSSGADYVSALDLSKGEAGTIPAGTRRQLWSQVYEKRTSTPNRKRYLLKSRTTYRPVASVTTLTYTYHVTIDGLAPKRTDVALPIVDATNNGSGAAAKRYTEQDSMGRVTWSKDASGAVTYTEYFPYVDQVKRRIVDVNTTIIAPSDTTFLNSYYPSPPESIPGGLTPRHLETTYEIEKTGRVFKITDPELRTRRLLTTLLAHGEMVTLQFPHLSATAGSIGGLMMTVSYQGGGARESCVGNLPAGIHADDAAAQDPLYYNNIWDSSAPTTKAALEGVLPPSSEVLTSRTVSVHNGGLLVSTRRLIDADGLDDASNVYETTFGYDDRGNRERVKDPPGDGGGTITRIIYDFLGRVVSLRVGTDDSGGGGDNMAEVEARAYDGAAIGAPPGLGDGRLTSQIAKPNGTEQRTSLFTYDDLEEGRVVERLSPSSIRETITYDWTGSTTGVKLYEPTAQGGKLKSNHESLYDLRGQMFESRSYGVDPATGSYGSGEMVVTRYWRSERGEVRKTLENVNVLRKAQFDGAGRLVRSTVSHDSAESAWAQAVAFNLSGDRVLEQNETLYDKAGNPVVAKRLERAVGYAGTDLLPHGAPTAARGMYTASWYDVENRLTDSAFYGHNGNTDMTGQPVPKPTVSTVNLLLSKSSFFPDGAIETSVDPQGIVTRYSYDDLGRLVMKTENDVGTPEFDAADRVTQYTYTVTDQVKSISAATAGAAGATPQTTTYIYGVAPGSGSDLTSNRLLSKIDYQLKIVTPPPPPGAGGFYLQPARRAHFEDRPLRDPT